MSMRIDIDRQAMEEGLCIFLDTPSWRRRRAALLVLGGAMAAYYGWSSNEQGAVLRIGHHDFSSITTLVIRVSVTLMLGAAAFFGIRWLLRTHQKSTVETIVKQWQELTGGHMEMELVADQLRLKTRHAESTHSCGQIIAMVEGEKYIVVMLKGAESPRPGFFPVERRHTDFLQALQHGWKPPTTAA